ncbi:MAG: LacI family transcriptional regulator [Sporolactobacillus sp.]|jgi:DNA-binding LacI/PurR family transcriptional regulator|nr:LacI family transcriptional regulator [Sporolactobacillus sp.]
MEQKITLKEIAKVAGVSISTASRVLNGNAEKVARESVKKRIWDAAQTHHYVPNKAAQELKNKNKGVDKTQFKIGVIFARLDKDDHNPFFIKIYQTVAREIIKRGCSIEFTIMSDVIREKSAKTFFEKYRVEGVIILGRFNNWLFEKVKRNVKHLIYVGLNRLLFGGLDQIICDGYSAAVSVVNYLHDMGHKKIMYLGETVNEARFKGYMHTMKFLNHLYSNEGVVECSFTIKSAYKVMKKKYNPNFTAIFCGNDLAGIGCVQALENLGFRIPEDVSIVSIDDIDLIQDYKPLLTTVHVPVEELAAMSVRMLFETLMGTRHIPVTIEFPYQLLQRQTVKKIN